MNKVFIICAKPNDFVLPKGIDFIGVEKGAAYLASKKISQVLAIGDFDSISKIELNKIKASAKTEILPTEKDVTDAEAAIIRAIEMGYKDITLFATGPRVDHFMNIMALTKKYSITFVNENNRVVYINNDALIKKDEYKYISFIADNKVRFTATGLKWNVENIKMDFSDTFATSNEIKKAFATISIKKGGLFVIQSND